MKTITLEVNDDIAEKLLAMNSTQRLLAFKLITDLDQQHAWKDLFSKTAEQAEKQGLTDQKLLDLLKKS